MTQHLQIMSAACRATLMGRPVMTGRTESFTSSLLTLDCLDDRDVVHLLSGRLLAVQVCVMGLLLILGRLRLPLSMHRAVARACMHVLCKAAGERAHAHEDETGR